MCKHMKSIKSGLQTPAGRLAIGFGRPAGFWSPDFILFILLHHLLYVLHFAYTF